jgi:pSer/pThr/pTyr-binding forkhead associated (FHA) protein
MSTPRLEVRDVLGERIVSMDRLPFTIGRRETNDLRLGGSEVSREHAEIAVEAGKFVLRDKASRYGTFVNGEPASECELRPGDRIRLGRGGGADLLFLAGDEERSLSSRSTTWRAR